MNTKIVQPPPDPGPGGGGGTITLDDGSWQIVDVPAGTAFSSDDGTGGQVQGQSITGTSETDQHVYVLHGDAGISSSPLSDSIKQDLLPAQDPYGGTIVSVEEGGDSVYVVSQETAEGIDASEAAGELTPEIAAIAEPLDDGGDVEASSYGPTPTSIFGGSCSPKPQSYSRSINLADKTYSKDLPLSGGFSGSISLTGHITGTVNGELAFDVKRKNVLGFCVPYGVKFKTLHAYGNATSNGGIDLTGTVNYSGTFGPWDIAKPTLAEFWVSVYGVPVKIGFNLPITSGLSLSATATGTLNFNGTHVATGSFDYTCTLSDCTGTHTFDNSPDGSNQEITGGLSGHIKPDPYLDVSVRAYIYSDSIISAQVGARGHLLGDLWGYDGNACGDADGDAVNETVRALTFDLDRRIDFVGKMDILGSNTWDHVIHPGTVKHVGFYDLIGSSALQPQLQGPAGLSPGATGQYKLRMRPCWPYTDQMTYKLNWGDGGADATSQGAPATDVQVSHSWPTESSPTVTATSVSDQHGRALNQAYSRTIQVKPLAVTVTPSPGSATYGNPITWTATATGGNPTTTKFAFFRRRAGTTPWTPDVTAASWQTSGTFTWTPAAADVGVWEIIIWVKDGDTPATQNTYGYAAYVNAGPVQVVAPLAVTCPASPAVSLYGNPITWTPTVTGGTPGTIQYSMVRQLVGTSTWVPATPAWQAGSTLSWTPLAGDIGTWQISILVKDVNTPANPGYTASCSAGQVKVVGPLSLSVTPSPASSVYGNPITWTATATGGDSASTRYAFFRRRAGTTPWTPDVTAPAWQASNVFTWTPTVNDVGTWEIYVWVKDATTPANANTYGYAAGYNPGPVQVVTPPLTLSVTASPAYSTSGNAITWTATAGGGTPATTKYALFHRRAGTTPWTPDVTAPVWQSGNVLSWTPAAADTGTWEIIVWVKDGDTPATMNTYGYGAYANAGPVQVVAPLTLTSTSTSPTVVTYGTTLTWTASSTGGVPGTVQYTLGRQLAGTSNWLPSPLVFQSSNVLTWTPTAADVGTWTIGIGVRDSLTSPTANGFGVAASVLPGTITVVAPLTVTGTGSPASSPSGTTLNWTATASGGDSATTRYAFFRRRAGTTPWTPDVTAPNWQSSNVMSWTPAAADAGTWEIIIWVKDGATAANTNTYGYSAYYNAGPVQVYNPITLTGTGSPSSANYGTTLTWTANPSGGTPGTFQYAFFRRRAGTTPWTPDVTAPAWQSSNVMSWTPTSADIGTWEIILWVKDANTPASQNTYGYGAYYNAGPVQIVAPLTVSGTGSPASSPSGTTLNWTANASGGNPATTQYALFRRRAGTTPWTPDVTAPAWQTSNVLSWTPTSADAGTWEIIIWAKDGNTASNANGYGYASYYNAGPVQVYNSITLTGTGSPSSANYGTTVNWTANPSGGTAGTFQYAFFRRRAGTTPWTPDVSAPAWQSSNVMSWTPASGDTGTWEIIIWVKDANTPASLNTYGYGAYYNAGPVQITAPLTVSGTGSPSSVQYGTTITWTANASGGNPSTTQYAFFRRRAGTTPWTPDVTAPAWQSSNTFSWTPTSNDVDTWEIIIWVRDGNTAANANTYGFAGYYNAGPVQVTAPPLTVTGTGSPSTFPYGGTLTWTATASGGVPSSRQYELFRRRAGTTPWTPDVTAPAWQSSNVLSWTPTSADAGTWEIIIWAKDGTTPATMNTYGYAAYYNAGPVQVTIAQAYAATGWVDGYNSQHIWGWACDPDYPTQNNRVDIGIPNGPGLGSAGAYLASNAGVTSACLGGTAHSFDFYPSGGIPSGTHFNVWSIDLPYATAGNDNRKIGGTGAIGDGTEFVIP
ncbi:MAG: hypothetical protein ACJ76N_16010 [Thermoanaerobaculia bacterium]